MKKLFALLLFLTAFAFTSFTQTNTTCNADFRYSISGLTVHFIPADTIVSITSHQYWNFGDGKISSDVDPAHVYASAGTYTVKHYVYKTENGVAVCIDSVEKRIELAVSTTCNIHAGFTFKSDSAQHNKIYFTNLSTPSGNIHGVKWTFGDGTYSYDLNPTHIYASAGIYTVCLVVQTENNCYKDTCAHVQVYSSVPCNLIAYFSWHPDSIQLNQIRFLNLSVSFEPGDSITWSFGDGAYSHDINPTHIYTYPGTYNVCIRVKKKTELGTTSCVKEFCKQVVVTHACTLEADFSFMADESNKNKIYFKNLSNPLSSVLQVLWTFGDGSSSTSMNPDHLYAHAGTYNVCLKISGGNLCYRQICKTVEIKEGESDCLEMSRFSFTRATGNCMEFKFTPAVQNADWKYVWTFGDGTGSLNITPSHVYQHQGRYIVFLTVYKSATCASTSYQVIETGACTSCTYTLVKYEYKRESPTSNRIYFYAVSNVPIISQNWTITKLPYGSAAPVILTQNNPVYVFSEPGDYSVCLRTVTYGGCVKEYCEVIHISPLHTYCILPAYPNPAENQVTVNVQLTQPAAIHLYVFNSLNLLVLQKEQEGTSGNNLITLNIETLTPGWYTIKIITGDRACYSRFQKI